MTQASQVSFAATASSNVEQPSWALAPLTETQQERLIAAARSKAPVAGLTHTLYRYPARFSPEVARTAIEALTERGEAVLDSFVGGGTSLVEALALGRQGIGTDISTLATFVSQAKTSILDETQLASVELWATEAAGRIDMCGYTPTFEEWASAGYFKHLDYGDRLHLRTALAQAVSWLPTDDPACERLARCVLLRTAQWALDGRKTIPSLDEFRANLIGSARIASTGIRRLSNEAGNVPAPSLVVNRSAVGLEEDAAIAALLGGRRPRLILTSPPYPGVHVLYHRWQVDGRKETGAPFWIANALDGAGGSYYTMGDRKRPDQRVYFETLAAAQKSLAAIADADTVIVQIVAFSRPEEQLTRYNAAAHAAGLEELRLGVLKAHGDGRLWREVPNRKWYNEQRPATAASSEVLLLYRLAR